MDNYIYESVYASLVAQSGGRHQISLSETAKVIGISQTTLYTAETLPFPVTLAPNGAKRVAISALAKYLTEKAGEPILPFRSIKLPEGKKKRGRPTKAEQLARQRAGGAA